MLSDSLPQPDESRQYPAQHFEQDPYKQQNFHHFQNAPYMPPDQYVNINQGDGYNPAGLSILSEIKDLEYRLDHGRYRCYRIWLYTLSFLSAIELIFAVISFSFVWDPVGFITSVITNCWMIVQCSYEVKAMKMKDIEMAYKAIWLMGMYALVNLAFILLTSIWYYNYYEKDNGAYEAIVILFLLWSYCIFLVVHFGITVFGAVRVHRILTKRRMLQRELEGGRYFI